MDVQELQKYEHAPTDALAQLYVQTLAHKKSARDAVDVAKNYYYFSIIQDTLQEYYDIGTLCEATQLFGGYINTTFGIYTEKDGVRQQWLFRMYRKSKNENALKFEHRLLCHAKENGFSYGAAPIYTLKGKTYCSKTVETEKGRFEYFLAVFNFLEGDVSYDWMTNWAEEGLGEITIETGAQCLAQFHSAAHDFDAEGLYGDNIMDSEDLPGNELSYTYPERMKSYEEGYAKMGLDSAFTQYFSSTYDLYHRMCKKCYIPPEDYAKMQYNPCHSDGHPGNFKYDEKGAVIGSFDYDMAKFDLRMFDLGIAIHYLFASWKFKTSGALRLDRVTRYLNYYNAEIIKIGKIPPFSETEKNYLFECIVQGTAYCTGWCTTAVLLDPSLNQSEYLYYAQHYAACMEWLENHEKELRGVIKDIL